MSSRCRADGLDTSRDVWGRYASRKACSPMRIALYKSLFLLDTVAVLIGVAKEEGRHMFLWKPLFEPMMRVDVPFATHVDCGMFETYISRANGRAVQ
ncbi:hypothetical protein JMJ78_0006563 [Colletotrichum scovillei]|nr:hypothetical protein JMJ78_0006563 [Colletotrichum scovillei]